MRAEEGATYVAAAPDTHMGSLMKVGISSKTVIERQQCEHPHQRVGTGNIRQRGAGPGNHRHQGVGHGNHRNQVYDSGSSKFLQTDKWMGVVVPTLP